jgi:hypothetical protein
MDTNINIISLLLTIGSLVSGQVGSRAGGSESYKIDVVIIDDGQATLCECTVPPGKAKMTTLLPANRSALVTSFHVNGLGPAMVASLTRALKVASGTRLPTVIWKRRTHTHETNTHKNQMNISTHSHSQTTKNLNTCNPQARSIHSIHLQRLQHTSTTHMFSGDDLGIVFNFIVSIAVAIALLRLALAGRLVVISFCLHLCS